MPIPRLISPILDGFQIDKTIDQRDGVHCCAVTEVQSQNPFVLKILSVPTSSIQMDALLMTGAFASRADANAYFKEEARTILNEAKTLRHMATLGGFADFDCVQVVPAADGSGFEIYLLSPWRENITSILQKNDLTHLEAVNMGLDLCAALTACRHAGYCYVNLKPCNVFQIGQHYRIGDLGFVPLSSIHRLSLPESYRSSYTPPELLDGSRPMNDTADVYALGLLLYQAYNGGKLPGKNDIVGMLYAPPLYADYEMAQIILRACAPDPAIRWKSPEQMGYALTRYLQRYGMRKTPVIPPILQELARKNQPVVEEFLPEYPDDERCPPLASQDDATANRPGFPQEEKHTLPVRRRAVPKAKRLPWGRLAVAILAVILLIELIIMACVLGQDKDESPAGEESTAAFQAKGSECYYDCYLKTGNRRHADPVFDSLDRSTGFTGTY